MIKYTQNLQLIAYHTNEVRSYIWAGSDAFIMMFVVNVIRLEACKLERPPLTYLIWFHSPLSLQ